MDQALLKVVWNLRSGSRRKNFMVADEARMMAEGDEVFFFLNWKEAPGGGFKDALFLALPGEMIQFDSCFSGGMKPPTRNYLEYRLNTLPKTNSSHLKIGGGPQKQMNHLPVLSIFICYVAVGFREGYWDCTHNLENECLQHCVCFLNIFPPSLRPKILDLFQLFCLGFKGHGSQALVLGWVHWLTMTCAQEYKI